MEFPTWKPQRVITGRFKHSDFKIRYGALRNSSSAFIKREDVRQFIFSRDENKCVKCDSNESLQVDHIISVLQCAKGELSLEYLNHPDNLQTLCLSCNAAKLP